MKKLFTILSMIFAVGTAANAQTQTFNLTADLTYSDLATAAVFGSSELTGTLTGQFSFDLSAPVVNTSGNAIAETASYEFTSLTFNIGNQVLNFTSDAAALRVLDVSNAFGTGIDQISLSGARLCLLSALTVQPYSSILMLKGLACLTARASRMWHLLRILPRV